MTVKQKQQRRGSARAKARNSQLEQSLAQQGWIAAPGLMFNDRQRRTWQHDLKLVKAA